MTNELRDAIDMMLAAASQANLTLNRVSDDERARASDARQARWDAVALTAAMTALKAAIVQDEETRPPSARPATAE